MSADKPWLKSYPPGVPAEIDLGEYTSLVAVLKSSCERYSHRPAFSNMGRTLSYGDGGNNYYRSSVTASLLYNF